MLTTSAAGQGHSDAANRSTGATRPLFAVRPAPAPRPRPLRGRRGAHAAPAHVPHPCALWPYFVCCKQHRRRRLTKWTGLHCARGCARPPIARGRPLRLGGRARACGAVAPQPATWGGVASGAWLSRTAERSRRVVVSRSSERSQERPCTPRRPQPLPPGTFRVSARPAPLHHLRATAIGRPAG